MMETAYLVTLVAAVGDDLDDATREVILDHVAEVADELVAIEENNPNLADSDMSASLHNGEVRLSVRVVGIVSLDEAARVGMSALRAAIHAAGGSTVGWEAHHWSVDFSDSALGDLVEV